MTEDHRIKNNTEWVFKDDITELIKSSYGAEMPAISTIPYMGEYTERIKLVFNGLTALCPVDGLQDNYRIVLFYSPDKSLPELMSLRRYFQAYRDLRISHEHIASKIRGDFVQAVGPNWIKITLINTDSSGITSIIKV